jgi:hypothetical protein
MAGGGIDLPPATRMKQFGSPQSTEGFQKPGVNFMQTTTARPAANVFRLNRLFLAAIIFLFISASVFFAFRSLIPASHSSLMPISQSVLESKYGLHVSLIALTAAGGKIDLRLKMVDAAKARLLLQDSKNFPVLVAANGVVLSIPKDEKPENVDFKDNSNLFLLFPNTGGAIQPGAPVTLLFGDSALEPINAR